MEMNILSLPIGLLVLLIGGLILVQPTQTNANVETEGIPAFNGCFNPYINPIFAPEILVEDPISMNTVKNGNIIKTIHAEKQVFLCRTVQGVEPVIVDMTIFVEIFEDVSARKVINKQAHVITCVKEGGPEDLEDIVIASVTDVLGCETESIPTGPAPVRNCTDSPVIEELVDLRTGERIIAIEIEVSFLDHPQEMNIVNKGNIVKTIEAQKEILVCNVDPSNDPSEPRECPNDRAPECVLRDPLNDKKVDIILFTEIWEDLGLLPNSIVKIEFLEVRCMVGLIVDEDRDGTEIPPVGLFGLDFEDFELEDFVPRVESCQFSTMRG